MDNPAFLLLCLEQGDRSLEQHLEDYIFLATLSNFPNECLCTFLYAGLNTPTKGAVVRGGTSGDLRGFSGVAPLTTQCMAKITQTARIGSTSSLQAT